MTGHAQSRSRALLHAVSAAKASLRVKSGGDRATRRDLVLDDVRDAPAGEAPRARRVARVLELGLELCATRHRRPALAPVLSSVSAALTRQVSGASGFTVLGPGANANLEHWEPMSASLVGSLNPGRHCSKPEEHAELFVTHFVGERPPSPELLQTPSLDFMGHVSPCLASLACGVARRNHQPRRGVPRVERTTCTLSLCSHERT